MLRSVFSARRRAFLLTATLGATVLGAGLAPMSGMAQTIPISLFLGSIQK